MKITLRLYKSLIIEAVKAETYIKGSVDRTTDDKNVGLAYHETAGDEEVHERKILRCIAASLAGLKSEVANFLSATVATSADNVVSTEEDDKITITILVSDRFNQSMCDPLAKMFSKYIEDNSLVLWWGTINPQQAQFYQSLLAIDIAEIKKLFAKTAPIAVEIPYTKTLSVDGSEIHLPLGEEDTITYTIDDDAIDDIEISSSNKCISVHHRNDGSFVIKGEREGVAHCTLYSRHDEVNVTASLDIVVFSEGNHYSTEHKFHA